MGLRDRLRGPASLVALSASYVARRPDLAWPALRVALDVGIRVRRAPVLAPARTLLARTDELVEVVSLVSDTHVVAAGRTPCELEADPAQWPWRQSPTAAELASGITRVLEHVVADAPRTVIWCGDEVDTGERAEWRELRRVIDTVPGLSHWMVPGNHDVSFNRPFDEDHELVRRAERERVYRAHAFRVAEFPVVDTIIGDAGPVTIALLDSCRHPSTHVLSNAIGRFGDDQLARLETMLAGVRGPLLVVAHHHVWRDAHFDPEAWFNTAVDSDRLAHILLAYSRRGARDRVLVCHGHRHMLTEGAIVEGGTSIAVLGLPSTTLGDKAQTGRLDGVLRYAVAGVRRDGSWGVALRDVGALVVRPRMARYQ